MDEGECRIMVIKSIPLTSMFKSSHYGQILKVSRRLTPTVMILCTLHILYSSNMIIDRQDTFHEGCLEKDQLNLALSDSLQNLRCSDDGLEHLVPCFWNIQYVSLFRVSIRNVQDYMRQGSCLQRVCSFNEYHYHVAKR
jgi:hypothetical protein